MLVLSRLQASLAQILAPPALHTAVLLTPAGQLVSFASRFSAFASPDGVDAGRTKDEIRVIAGLSGEVWQETWRDGEDEGADTGTGVGEGGREGGGAGMVDSELGRIVVLPVDDPAGMPSPLPEDYQPLMLLVLNATDEVEWEEMQAKGKALAAQIAKPLSKFRQHLVVRKPPPMPSAVTSPARAR
ncbi:hypothetical protein C8R45DRAFT_54217 [Mycena sanguinolenta]|nr:hypothetical protein C8R45DRAFT_54217 [Mycena sanguinolenta]